MGRGRRAVAATTSQCSVKIAKIIYTRIVPQLS